jgi:spermidine synthase
MLPWRKIDTGKTPDGNDVALYEQNGEYSIRVGPHELMSSRLHGSEDALANVACEALAGNDKPCILIGGLGMGYTVRAALEKLPVEGRIVVAELLPQVVAWNRGPLADLAGRPLEDSRVEVLTQDVRQVLADAKNVYDAILLDVDNGPSALTTESNQWLYRQTGLRAMAAALRPGGLIIVWSAGPDVKFEAEVKRAGMRLETRTAMARELQGRKKKGGRHTLFLIRVFKQGSAHPPATEIDSPCKKV